MVTASGRRDGARVGRAAGAGGGAPPAHRRGLLGGVQPGRGAGGDGVHRQDRARVGRADAGHRWARRCQHADAVASAAFSPDGARVVTASDDRTARVWDARTGAPVGAPLSNRPRIVRRRSARTGRGVVTASYDKTARVWDARTGGAGHAPLQHTDGVLSAAFSPDGTRVVTATADATARVWDARTGRRWRAPAAHAGAVVVGGRSAPTGRAWSRRATDKTARVWDARTGEPVSPPLQHADGVLSGGIQPGRGPRGDGVLRTRPRGVGRADWSAGGRASAACRMACYRRSSVRTGPAWSRRPS